MGLFGSVGKFLRNAAKTAGKPIHSAVHAVSKVTGDVAHLAGKVPVVGPAFHATFDAALAAPFALADSVASGRRVDKAVLDNVKRQVGNVKEVAPYAQTVVSVIPGAGQGVSGIIGGSLALAEGQPITKALQTGVLDSVPGGPAAKAIAKISLGVMKGDKFDKITLDALPIPDAQKKLFSTSLAVMKDIANKRPIAQDMTNELLQYAPGGAQAVIDFAKKNNLPIEVAAVERTIKTLSPELQKAVKIGATVGHARRLQKIALKAANGAISVLQSQGFDIVHKAVELQPLAKGLSDPSGFYIGTALMQKSGVNPGTLSKIRKTLAKGDQVKGFDMALSAHIGKVTSPKRAGTPAQLAGYYVTKGMSGASKAQRKGMLKTVIKSPDMKKGAAVATAELEGVFSKLLRYFGLA